MTKENYYHKGKGLATGVGVGIFHVVTDGMVMLNVFFSIALSFYPLTLNSEESE